MSGSSSCGYRAYSFGIVSSGVIFSPLSLYNGSFEGHRESVLRRTKRNSPALESSSEGRVFQTRIMKGRAGAVKGILDYVKMRRLVLKPMHVFILSFTYFINKYREPVLCQSLRKHLEA